MGVAEAAIAAARQHDALADFGQVGEQRLLSSSNTCVPTEP